MSDPLACVRNVVAGAAGVTPANGEVVTEENFRALEGRGVHKIDIEGRNHAPHPGSQEVRASIERTPEFTSIDLRTNSPNAQASSLSMRHFDGTSKVDATATSPTELERATKIAQDIRVCMNP